MPLSLSPGLWTLCPLILTLPPFSTLPTHGSLQALRQTRSALWLCQPRLAQTPSIHYNVQVGYWPRAWALFPSLLLLLPWLEVIPNPPAIRSYIVDSFLSWVLFYSQLISHELAFSCSPGASSVIISLQLEFNPFRGWRGGHGAASSKQMPDLTLAHHLHSYYLGSGHHPPSPGPPDWSPCCPSWASYSLFSTWKPEPLSALNIRHDFTPRLKTLRALSSTLVIESKVRVTYEFLQIPRHIRHDLLPHSLVLLFPFSTSQAHSLQGPLPLPGKLFLHVLACLCHIIHAPSSRVLPDTLPHAEFFSTSVTY